MKPQFENPQSRRLASLVSFYLQVLSASFDSASTEHDDLFLEFSSRLNVDGNCDGGLAAVTEGESGADGGSGGLRQITGSFPFAFLSVRYYSNPAQKTWTLHYDHLSVNNKMGETILGL